MLDKDSVVLAQTKNIPEPKLIFHSPWFFIPILYFVEGLPYYLINNVSVLFYKNLGVDNAQIALWTSFLYLPWVIKLFWGPVVDLYSTKRNWILYSQFATTICLVGLAFSLQLPSFLWISLLILAIASFVAATYDIATDGFYLLVLNREAQAFFVGIRSIFYRLAAVFCTGILVFWAGKLEVALGDSALSWTIAIATTALLLAIFSIFNWFTLPNPEKSDSYQSKSSTPKLSYWQIIKAYFSQNKVWAVVAFILLYRLGEAMLVKLSSPFFLDQTSVGGLGLSTSTVGLAYGTFGSIALIIGGGLGGILVAKYGVKKCLLPMALALNLPNLFYIYMAYAQPAIELIYLLVAIEQFGYGLGTAAYSVYLMYFSKDDYKTSHFAISTAIMALGMMLPGLVSGYLQQLVGYQSFFIIVALLTIPGMVTIFFVPSNDEISAE